jgi:DNA-directed RNA polymerase delta subunit|tara:strand:- start:136 stop:321 length:186 start_codon:yes stop_codon:yes gene_type:complete
MKARARIKLELINGAQKIFKFTLRGLEYDELENQIQSFAQTKKNQYGRKIKILTWELVFLD